METTHDDNAGGDPGTGPRVRPGTAAVPRDAHLSDPSAGLLLRLAPAAPRHLSAGGAWPAIRSIGHSNDDGTRRHAYRRALPSGVRDDLVRRSARREGGDAGGVYPTGRGDCPAAPGPWGAPRRGRVEGCGTTAAAL